MKNKLIKSDSYERLLENIRKELSVLESLIKTRTVMTYHKIGGYIFKDILENKSRADYGEYVIKRLAQDLGMGKRTLARAVQFHKEYPQIVPDMAQLTWTHFIHLLTVKDTLQRNLLQNQAVREDWDSEQLRKHIQSLKQRRSKPKPEEIPQLSFTRGRLNTYKIIKFQEENFIDLGFQIRINFFKDKISEYNEGDFIEVEPLSHRVGGTGLITKEELYTYKAQLEEVIDGDTLWVIIDSGFEIFIRQKLRFRGIDCPEINTPEGQRAKKFVQDRLKGLEFIIVKTYKDQSDKYDRYLTDIFYPPLELRRAGSSDETDSQKVADAGNFLNQELLNAGLAKKV